jgi:hypothetical protein
MHFHASDPRGDNMKKKLIISTACILVAVIAFRMLGWIDINLYKSELSTNQTVTSSKAGMEGKTPFSYHLILREGSSIIDELKYIDGDSPSMEIECVINEINYSGNYFLPFVKNFKTKYKCSITTLEPDGFNNVTGEITGDIDGRVIGICSVKKVKKIVLAEIKKSVMDILSNRIKP